MTILLVFPADFFEFVKNVTGAVGARLASPARDLIISQRKTARLPVGVELSRPNPFFFRFLAEKAAEKSRLKRQNVNFRNFVELARKFRRQQDCGNTLCGPS